MKRKILLASGLAILLTSGLYASHNNMHKNCEYGAKNFKHKMMKKHSMKRHGGLMAMFKKLNLSEEQKEQISQIRKDMMKNRLSPSVAFTKDSFDKAKFIKIMKEKRENRIKSRADIIEKVYAILSSKQKEQFKVLLDLRAEKRAAMMERGMKFDKNCNDRR